MQKEESIQNSAFDVDWFAKNLVRLHSIDVATLGINVLKPPGDNFAFARRSLLYFKILLNLSPRHSEDLRKDFKFALGWLESNVSSTRCPKYCLLHGDYRAHINAFLTKGSRMVVLDWESAEIGDPAYDVGYAYARMRANLGEKTADRFVQEYVRNFDGDIAKRLLFYELAANLRLAILHSAVLSNPRTAYEIRGIKAFLLFPFLRLPFIAKKTRTDQDVTWVECFKEFVEKNFRR
jgi:aminoglycoside phosphotransferase (APT) family kinase protein